MQMREEPQFKRWSVATPAEQASERSAEQAPKAWNMALKAAKTALERGGLRSRSNYAIINDNAPISTAFRARPLTFSNEPWADSERETRIESRSQAPVSRSYDLSSRVVSREDIEYGTQTGQKLWAPSLPEREERSRVPIPQIPTKPDVIVAILGMTGAGKSSFISRAVGSRSVIVGHSLNSETSEIQAHRFQHNGINYQLIDTPGFDDSRMSNEEVTNMLVSWLETSYRLGQRLSGIVYVHNISKPRVQGSAFQNMRMFRTMCGSDALRNVTFATSFWDIVDVDTAEARERELAESGDLWANMVRRGAQVVRLGTDRASALEVLERFADSKAKGLSVQREMVLQRKEFEDTTAGRSTEVGIAIALEKDFEKDKQALKQHIDAKQAQRDQKYTSAIENLKYDSTQLSQQAQSTLESAKEENRRVLREEARNQSSQRKEVRQQVKTLQAQQEGVTAKYEAARRENKAQEKRDKKEKERLNQEVKKIKSEKRKVEANVAEQTYYEPVYQNYYRGRY